MKTTSSYSLGSRATLQAARLWLVLDGGAQDHVVEEKENSLLLKHLPRLGIELAWGKKSGYIQDTSGAPRLLFVYR